MSSSLLSNPFECHNVKNLSPYSINKFADNPAKWLTNVAGYRDNLFAVPFTFGLAIEAGITAACREGKALEESISDAMDIYTETHKEIKEANALYDFDACNKRQRLVEPVLTNIIPDYLTLGTPTAAQRWVEYQPDWLPIPIKGIIDLEYRDVVRDIKTTGRKPSGNANYHRQLAFYALATGKEPKVDYIYWTTKQSQLITMDVPDIEGQIEDIKRISLKMMRLLSMSDDIEEICEITCFEPDLSNANWWNRWGKNEAEGARKLFSIR